MTISSSLYLLMTDDHSQLQIYSSLRIIINDLVQKIYI